MAAGTDVFILELEEIISESELVSRSPIAPSGVIVNVVASLAGLPGICMTVQSQPYSYLELCCDALLSIVSAMGLHRVDNTSL